VKPLGRSGVGIAPIGQGTWQLPTGGRSGERSVALLRRGLGVGLTHIDTAEMYGDGAVERLVGRAVAGRRARVFLASKVLPRHASYDGTLAACERSLGRLQTDHLDLYMIHWPGALPIADTMRAMERLVDEGMVRHIGVSNFDVEDLRRAQRALRHHRIVANQVLYHLRDRGIEHRLLPYCARSGVTVVAYSPLGAGAFPAQRGPGGRTLAAVAAARALSRHQVALAFLLRHQRVVAIPRTTNVDHQRDNAGAADVHLDLGEVAAIDGAFPRPAVGTPLGTI
jgi:diketogulonate reductase-like aldo/keto reductase